VIRLGAETETGQRRLAGWIEEVNTARAIRFQSTAELIEFLEQCFEESAGSEEGGQIEPRESRATDRPESVVKAQPDNDVKENVR